MAESSIWAGRLADTQDDLMIVGHLPHLSKLVGLLLNQDEASKALEFQMGCVVCCDRDESSRWSIQWIVTPKMVSAISE
jgi:phosphohistidine phosphatase